MLYYAAVKMSMFKGLFCKNEKVREQNLMFSTRKANGSGYCQVLK